MKYVILFSVFLSLAITAKAQQPPQVDSNAPGWQRVPFPADAQSLSFVNPDTGWVVGDNGAFYTSDAGQHWQLRASGGFGQVHFFDANEGWLLNGRMLHTLNGGLTWDTLGYPASNVHWINRDTGFILGRAIIEMLTREDTGWKRIIASNLDAGAVICLGRFDAKHYLALGAEHYVSAQYPSSPTILRSDDGGVTWYRPEWAEGAGHFSDLLIIDSTRALGFGANWRTTDRGSTWLQDTVLDAAGNVSFLPSGFGMGTSWNGYIAVSTDTGSTWAYEPTGTFESTTAIQVIDSANAFAVGLNGLVLRTTNGGYASVGNQQSIPLSVQAYPDPTQQNVAFDYTLPEFQHVTFAVYSVSGTLVATLANADEEATGTHSLVLNTMPLASGSYSFLLSSESYSATGQFQITH